MLALQVVVGTDINKNQMTVINPLFHKKRRFSPKSQFKEECIKRAVMMVRNEKVSIRRAAMECGLSYSFVHRRITGVVKLDSRNGPNPIFTAEEEAAFATWLVKRRSTGMKVRAKEFLAFVQKHIQKDNRKMLFKNGTPSYDWYKAFLARNSHILDS